MPGKSGGSSGTTTTTTAPRSGSMLGQLQQQQQSDPAWKRYAQARAAGNTTASAPGGYGKYTNALSPAGSGVWTAYNNPDIGSYPTYPTGGGGGGGGGYGGGGGGGGIKPLSPEAFDAMIAALNKPVNQAEWQNWDFQQWNPAAYEGTPISAWDDTLFRQAGTALNQGYANASNQQSQATDYARNALQQNDQLYANLRAAADPTFSPQMQGGISTLGGDPRVVNEANMNAAAADTAFTRFLGANDLVNANSQVSRHNEANLASQYFMNQLNQQKLADQTGLGIAETRDKQRWQERADERTYADNILGQNWGREASMANWQGGNQAGQFNAQGQNSTNQFNTGALNNRFDSTLSPFFQLIMQANEAGLPIDLKQLGLA